MNVLHAKIQSELSWSSTSGFAEVPKKQQSSSHSGSNNSQQ